MSIRNKVVGTGLALTVGIGATGHYYWTHPDSIPEPVANFLDDSAERVLQPAPTIPDLRPENVIGRMCYTDKSPCTTSTAMVTMAEKDSIPKKYDEFSTNLIAAVISSEDRRFWEHEGVNGKRTLEALFRDIKAMAFVQGGSTIDVQVVENAYEERSEKELRAEGALTGLATPANLEVARKISAMRVALALNNVPEDQKLERKKETLTTYLNVIYWGRGAYGAGAASYAYFNKPVEDLELREAAFLAAIIPLPDTLSIKSHNPEDPGVIEATRRYKIVFDGMVDSGKISAEVAEREKAVSILDFVKPYNTRPDVNINNSAQVCGDHLVEYMFSDIKARTGLGRQALISSGAIVETTINSGDQAALCDAMKNDANIQRPEIGGAGIAMHQSGAINAMFGGENFNELQVNLATQAKREAGSVFKGLIAALAFQEDKSLTLETEIDISTPVEFEGDVGGKKWIVKPKHTGEGIRKMQIQDIIEQSDNVGAARLVKDYIGVEKFVEVLQAFSIPAQQLPSVILGTGEYNLLQITTAMNSLILNLGEYRPAFITKSVTVPVPPKKEGDKLEYKVLYRHEPEAGRRVISERPARLAIIALNQVITGTNGTARGIPIPKSGPNSVAGKTGTGDSNTDFYFVGSMWHSNGGQTAGVYAGNPKGKIPIKDMSSNNIAAPWGRYMSAVSDANQGSLIG